MSQIHSAAPTLKIFALQHQGQAQDLVWSSPEHSAKVAFDEILSCLGAVDEHTLTHARYCTLERMGSALQPVWLLGNSSHEIVCSVNQRVLAAGSQIRLDHGDEIELGLTRLVVSFDGMVLTPAADGPQPAVENSHFRLTDLDAVADTASLPENERYGANRADFSDLISFTPEETVLPPAPQAAAPAAPVAPTLQEALAAGTQPSYEEKVSDLLAQFAEGASTARQETAPLADDPLDALHAQYLYKLRNPSHSDDAIQWQDLVRGGQSKLPDPMQQWMHLAGTQLGLDDLLGQSQSIASVMDALDPLGTSEVLKPEPFDSVMHLFAPENLRVETDDTLAALVQRSLPGLTRREHHSLSLDSAMPFTGGEDLPSKHTKP